MRNLLKKAVIVLSVSLLVPALALCDTVTFNTATNATTSGGKVNATMSVTTTAGGFDVTMVNLLADPGNIAQVITGLELTLNSSLGSTSKTQLKGGALQSSSAIIRSISSTGSYSDTTGSTNWQFSGSFYSGGLALCAAGCGVWHPEGAIGPPGTNGLYNNANPSITNGPHTPEIFGTLQHPVTFHVYAAGVTESTVASSLFSGARFVFGTGGESVTAVSGTPPPPPPPGPVPEPSSILLLGTGIASVAGVARRKLGL